MSQTKTVLSTPEIEQIVQDTNMTKSAKIRSLHALGIERGDISRILSIRYQHVRNVLITPLKKS
jgi:hypothetical protein